MSAEETLVFQRSDVRKIALGTPNCVEIRPPKHHPNILSFLKITEPDPARIQIYVDTGTVVILRVLNGSVRHMFIPKCKFKKLESIFKDPQELSLTDLNQLQKVDNTNGSANVPNDEKGSTTMTDDVLLEIGETVLAAESEALKSHYTSLKKKSLEENLKCPWMYHFSNQDVAKQVQRITTSSKAKLDSIKCIAMNGTSAIFLHGKGKGWTVSGKIPSALWTKLSQTKSIPTYASLGSKGRYYVSFKNNKTNWDGPKSMDLLFLVRPVRCVAFGVGIDDIIVVYKDGSWKHFGSIPTELEKILYKDGKSRNVECITLGPHGEYFVRDRNGSTWWGGLSGKVESSIQKMKSDTGKTVEFIDFGDSAGTFLIMFK